MRSDIRKKIDQQLTFALYGATNRMVRLHKPLLEPLGLTFPQYLVMVELLDDAPRSVGDLGAKLGMDTGTITPLLKRLEHAGFVTRRRDTKDERRVFVDMTSAGLAARDCIWAIPDKIISACRVTDEDANALHDKLQALGRQQES